MPEKFTSLEEVVRMIPDGAHIAFGGFTVQRHPMALIYEMIRQKKRNLHVYGHSPGGDLDILIGAGCVARIEIAYEADEAFGTIGPCLRRAIEEGAIEWEDYSNFAMVLRFSAGALGLPFLPTKTMFGSDLLKREGFPQTTRAANPKIASAKFHTMECPFTHENLVLVPAINADFCVLHAQQVGSDGTVRILGQSFGDVQEALGARTLIVTCEEVVDANQLRAEAERNQIPFFRVDHVVEVPYGAHPYACYKYYDYDPEQLAIYHDRAKDAKTFESYLNDFVYGVKDHKAYLERVGGAKRLDKLAADATLGYNPTLKRRL
ncbi:MAG TPA: CoA transferase [bacterium]|nr:CoA transferase [bacterium]